jgi:hypothetical protein
MTSEQEAYDALCAYTLTHGDPTFIHQHVVDAFAAQHADERSKPISVTFALVGLYLLIEKQFSGMQVQRAHMELARHRQSWPTFDLPDDRGTITAIEVMAASEGPERDKAIHAWCASIWASLAENREKIVELLRQHRII